MNRQIVALILIGSVAVHLTGCGHGVMHYTREFELTLDKPYDKRLNIELLTVSEDGTVSIQTREDGSVHTASVDDIGFFGAAGLSVLAANTEAQSVKLIERGALGW